MGLASSGAQGADCAGAAVFWRSELHPPVLSVRAEACRADDPDAVDLLRLPCAATLRMTADGREEVLVADGPRCIRIEVAGGTLLGGPVRLHYRLSGFVDIESKVLTLRRLVALHRLGRLPHTLFPPERRARRWAQAFQAHDGAQAGASHREIAIALFGRDRVTDDWREGDHMRMRVHRLIRTADKLIDGGYRELLR